MREARRTRASRDSRVASSTLTSSPARPCRPPSHRPRAHALGPHARRMALTARAARAVARALAPPLRAWRAYWDVDHRAVNFMSDEEFERMCEREREARQEGRKAEAMGHLTADMLPRVRVDIARGLDAVQLAPRQQALSGSLEHLYQTCVARAAAVRGRRRCARVGRQSSSCRPAAGSPPRAAARAGGDRSCCCLQQGAHQHASRPPPPSTSITTRTPSTPAATRSPSTRCSSCRRSCSAACCGAGWRT